MRLPRVPETVAALLLGALTWALWPWSDALVASHFPALPGILALAAAYLLVRATLSPLHAALAWVLAATAHRRPRDPPA